MSGTVALWLSGSRVVSLGDLCMREGEGSVGGLPGGEGCVRNVEVTTGVLSGGGWPLLC